MSSVIPFLGKHPGTNVHPKAPANPTILNFFTSNYLQFLVFQAIIVNRIREVASPRRPQQISFHSQCIIRLPLIVLLSINAAILYDDFISNDSKDSAADVLFNTFRLFCVAVDVEVFLECIERGNIQAEQSLNLLEWGLIMHFYQPGNKDVVMITLIQCVETIVMQSLGLFGLDRKIKLIPTTICGLASLAHFVLNYDNPTFPGLVSLAKWPEIFSLVIIVVVSVIYGVTWVMTGGKLRRKPCSLTRVNLPKLSDAYSLAVFKFGGACLDAAQNSPLRNEDEPIVVPNSSSIQDKFNQASIGFAKLDAPTPLPPRSSDFPLLNFLRLTTVYTHIVQVLLRRRSCPPTTVPSAPTHKDGEIAHNSNLLLDSIHSDDDEDEEYVDGSNYWDETESQNERKDFGSEQEEFEVDISDNDNSSEISNDTEIYKELFFLNSDALSPIYDANGHLVSDSALHTFTPTPYHVLDPCVVTRSQSRALQLSTPGQNVDSPHAFRSLISFIRQHRLSLTGNPVTNSDRDEDSMGVARHFSTCVVCQDNRRSIVLRPCGCLCLCDACREILAERRYVNCPTCRAIVQSYSKIFEP